MLVDKMILTLIVMAAVASARPREAPVDLAAVSMCVPPGQWLDRKGRPLDGRAALARAAAADVVLLGERHATPAHHIWQRNVIAALVATGRPVVIGLEQLPMSAQRALDAYVAGRIDEAAFLQQAEWSKLWGHDFAAYRPVFDHARAFNIPMRALNVDRAFVRKVGQKGFAAAAAEGAPIGRPASADPAYVARLEKDFRAHAKVPSAEVMARFVEAQTVWDRAMAEGLFDIQRSAPKAIAVGLMGHGHVQYGHGVAYQLASLGKTDVFSAIAVATTGVCSPEPDSADALYGAD